MYWYKQIYDTQTGQQIKWHWNIESTAPVRWTGNAFATSSQYFTVSGDMIDAPKGLTPAAVENTIVLETVSQSMGHVFWIVAGKDAETGKTASRLMARSSGWSLSEPIDFYGEEIMELGSNSKRFLLWGEGYREMLIVDLSW